MGLTSQITDLVSCQERRSSSSNHQSSLENLQESSLQTEHVFKVVGRDYGSERTEGGWAGVAELDIVPNDLNLNYLGLL